ncbi:MAG: protein kinase [Myxococcota bacterium]
MQNGYELIRRLAQGGMGEVFVARRTGAGQFEKKVALKLLLPHLVASPEFLQRFYAEARLAARMHHPNIVEIFDVGEADGRPFIAMQLVEGISLQRLNRVLRERGERLALPLVRLLATGICEALHYAHSLTDGRGRPLKLVHRDVTPSNILVSSAGQVLLTDFGIARVQDAEGHTRPGEVRGKAAYLAPEQLLHDARIDARTDLYSAALTLYELLTGENPYRRPSMPATLEAVLLGARKPLREVRPDVSEQLAAAVERALARRPEDRFPDARALREAIVDGPVATAPELAAEVRRLCGDALVSATREEPNEGPGTRSVVVTVTPTVLELPAAQVKAPRAAPPTRRWALRLAVLTLVSLAGGAGAWWLSADAAGRTPPVTANPAATMTPPAAPAPVEVPRVEPAPAGTDVAVETAPGAAEDDRAKPPPVVAKAALRPRAPKGPKPPAALRVGYVSADAVPWAEVLLDGRLLDRTPFARYPLPVGRHVLVFRGPDGREQQRTVTVTEGGTSTVRVEFPAEP